MREPAMRWGLDETLQDSPLGHKGVHGRDGLGLSAPPASTAAKRSKYCSARRIGLRVCAGAPHARDEYSLQERSERLQHCPLTRTSARRAHLGRPTAWPAARQLSHASVQDKPRRPYDGPPNLSNFHVSEPCNTLRFRSQATSRTPGRQVQPPRAS